MRVALLSNWGAIYGCGVANFGVDFGHALEAAGHTVERPLLWQDITADKVIVNWDSGTLPTEAANYPSQSIYYVHHVYRGRPEAIDEPSTITFSPLMGFRRDLPYPVPSVRYDRPVTPGTLGVTTIRGEGIDYLGEACHRMGWTLCLPDRWRTTEEEVERLSHCHALAAWYSDSPGRSLALATMIAAQRPILLSLGSRMFEYAHGSDEIYWQPYAHDPNLICEGLHRILADSDAGTERIPRKLAEWSWPKAIRLVEEAW